MSLSDSQVKALKPTDKRYSKSDGEGLSIDVMPTGKKSWTLELVKHGKRTRKKLGTYPTLSLKDARELAQKERKQAIMGVKDVTLGEVIDEWIELYSKAWTSEKYRYTVLYRIGLVTDTLRHRMIYDITRKDIADQIAPIVAEQKKVTADRALRNIKAIFDYAIVRDYIQANPCHLVEKMIPEHTVTNMACLPFEQMPKFWATVNQTEITNEVRIALALYNYLAVRPNELANAKWAEIDLEKGIWLIPAHRMKMRKEHMIPLASQPLELFKWLYEHRKSDEYVFINRTNLAKPMPVETPLAAIKRAGFAGKMTTHGFRALFSTHANNSKLWDSDVIERCLAHVEKNKGRAAYNRAEYWEHRVKLMQWWADIVSEWVDASL